MNGMECITECNEMLSLLQGLSQTVPGFGALSQSGLSQLDPSQDAFLSADFQSQMDGLLSQDSTYQGGRSAFMRQGSQFTQVRAQISSSSSSSSSSIEY